MNNTTATLPTTTPITVKTHTPTLKTKTKTCSICHKKIDADSKELALIGPVGPQCYSNFAAIETGLKKVEGVRYTDELQAIRIVGQLAKLGLKAKTRKHGHIFKSETWSWSIEVTGQLNQTSKRREQYGATFEQNRQKYANHLKAAAAKRQAVAA